VALTIVTAGGAWLALDQMTGTGQGEPTVTELERELRFVDPIVVPLRPVSRARSECGAERLSGASGWR
jgi:hypothetical protein